MIARFTWPALTALAALALAAAVPSIPQTARRLAGLPVTPAAEAARPGTAAPADDGHGHGAGGQAERPGEKGHAHGEGEAGHAEEGKIAMTAEQVEAAGIRVAAVGPGVLVNRVAVPGVLAASQDRLARVTARVGGTVAFDGRQLLRLKQDELRDLRATLGALEATPGDAEHLLAAGRELAEVERAARDVPGAAADLAPGLAAAREALGRGERVDAASADRGLIRLARERERLAAGQRAEHDGADHRTGTVGGGVHVEADEAL